MTRSTRRKKIGIAGASGYAGAELLRLCAAHPGFEVVVATAGNHAGERASVLYPNLTGALGAVVYGDTRAAAFEGLDLVFCALPHGESQRLVVELDGHVGAIVDLAGDFRLTDGAAYVRYYGEEHRAAHLLGSFAYGLPELFRDDVLRARARPMTALVAAPGCYPTAAALALAPLVRAGLVDPHGVIVDAASGVSGAGRQLAQRLHFATANEDFTAYGLLDHRHTPEIEQATGATVLFTPHLAPMTRGILATCYARPASGLSASGGPAPDEALAMLEKAYSEEPFVSVSEELPSTKATWGSNRALLTARHDSRTGWLLVLCALDNLGKGAAGQAVQCANLLLGLDEAAGLSAIGVYP